MSEWEEAGTRPGSNDSDTTDPTDVSGAADPPLPGPGAPTQPDGGPGSHAAAVSHASRQEDASAQAEGLGDDATGDIVIDAALKDLQAAPPEDLDAQIDAGQQVHETLQGRLSDLGGE